MDRVVDKNYVLIAINKVHDRFGGVAAGERRKKVDYLGYEHFLHSINLNHYLLRIKLRYV